LVLCQYQRDEGERQRIENTPREGERFVVRLS